MMKINKFLTIVILTLFLIASMTSAFGIKKTSEQTEDLIFEFSFTKPKLEKITVKGEIYDRITIDSLLNSYDLGEPCLPVKPVKILLPQGRDVENIEVYTSDKYSLGTSFNVQVGGKVVPITMKKHVTRERDSIPSVVSDSLYSNIGVYIYRGFSILHVNLYPVQYDPNVGEISYYNNMRLVVETKESSVNRAFRGLSKDYNLVENIVDNPSYVSTYTSGKSSITQVYDYIIITNSKLKRAKGEYTFQDLMEYKASKGMNPKIVTVGEILLNPDYGVNGQWGDNNPSNPFYQSEIIGSPDLFDDKPAKIRNFIRYAYKEWGTDYVLLGGDADVANSEDNIIPLRGLFANESGLPLNNYMGEEEDDIPSDVYYACLDGNFNYDCDMHFGECAVRNDLTEVDEADLYSEVWVGRACADSEEEVSNFVMKTLKYEQYTDVSDFDDILFVGEYLGNLFYYPYGGYYKDDMEHLVPSQFNLHKFYDYSHPDNNWYPEELADEIYTIKPQIINHDGHGYVDYMFKTGSYFFRELTNEKPFFVYSHSCLTGSFDNWGPWGGYQEDDCIAEILTCESPYGAFACILNARYGLGSEDSPFAPSGGYDESFYEALFVENIKELGRASHYSKEDNVWRIDENGYRWCYYQTNLFGDPELRIKDPAEERPNKPSKPQGETNGKTGEEYTFTSSSTDPKGSQLLYLFDWGDGSNSGWLGPFESGETATGSYTWDSSDSYQVKVCAKNMDGIISEWSDPLSVSMPKNKMLSHNILFFQFLEKILNQFPLLEKLLSIFNY